MSDVEEALDKYRGYLEAERGLSPYTVRNYTMDLIGNYARGSEKGFFQMLGGKIGRILAVATKLGERASKGNHDPDFDGFQRLGTGSQKQKGKENAQEPR